MSSQRQHKRISVAEYLSGAIGLTGKLQREIANEVGYDNPNVITLFKQGKTKLPVNKVPAMAKALGVDQANLLRIVMSEYMPETWEVLSAVIGDRIMSEDERALLEMVKKETHGLGVSMEDPELVTALREVLAAHAKKTQAGIARGTASVKRGRPSES
jgi:hypothetical protein